MSGLMRNVIDQVLKNMGEEERTQSVNYVTDRMVEKMDNQERVTLLLAIIDRVMSNLSAEERADLAARVADRMSGSAGVAAEANHTYTGEEVPVTEAPGGATDTTSPAAEQG